VLPAPAQLVMLIPNYSAFSIVPWVCESKRWRSQKHLSSLSASRRCL